MDYEILCAFWNNTAYKDQASFIRTASQYIFIENYCVRAEKVNLSLQQAMEAYRLLNHLNILHGTAEIFVSKVSPSTTFLSS
jgi:hypothetical protein